MNVQGIHPWGAPYLAGQTPPWGPSVLAVLLGQWRELVQMAVT